MAEPSEIIDAMEALAIHCRAPLMDVESRARWMRDWCEDLKQYPGDAIRAATARWRQGESGKFPTPGQLLPLVRAASPQAPQAGVIDTRAWFWPSEDDLASMTLHERKRQFTIMAVECRGKAGPMNDAGVHPRPEWLVKARNYDVEAKRIAELMARGAQKRESEAK